MRLRRWSARLARRLMRGMNCWGIRLATRQLSRAAYSILPLFWRALAPTHLQYRANVQLIDWAQTESWGVSEPLFIGADPREHPPDRFVLERHRIRVAEDAPPYVGTDRDPTGG